MLKKRGGLEKRVNAKRKEGRERGKEGRGGVRGEEQESSHIDFPWT